MFTLSTIKTGLFGMIGFRNTSDPDYKQLESSLTASSSGMYWNDFHPLITYKNLYSIAPNYDGFNYDAWSASVTYAEGDIVISSNIAYYSLTGANANHVPASTLGTWWKLPVNDWLTEKVNASISHVTNQVFLNKKINASTKTFLENVQLFDGAGRMQDVITPASRFVGLRIRPKRINNVRIIVDYIGLQFTQAQTDLKLYLFHSSQYSEIASFTLSTINAYSFDWKAPVGTGLVGSLTLNYVDHANNIDSGGDYFLGYFEDDIKGNAIKKRHQFTDPPCGGCNSNDLGLYNLWNQFFDIQPFEVANSDLNGTNLWDLSKTSYPLVTNFGLNLSVSVKFDITELIISNKSLFTEALGYQFAYDIINEFLYNPESRLNQHGDNAQKNSALYELNNPNDESTLKHKLDKTIEALCFDLSRLSQSLPETSRRRIHYDNL